ncbi:lipopolysaccharide biosynthesis protein [Shewanella sp. 10N.286.51.B7]|uniref:lipopolysaccharide biosynthesis protein n=1 Tax=Shewanella sp. 10N.286.51.B7 TaxID=1880836 RepID=UPI001F52B59C|nr:lipopolysaccharide biosynthesis protein [Shewanella sp. 10N.286.51.B7]
MNNAEENKIDTSESKKVSVKSSFSVFNDKVSSIKMKMASNSYLKHIITPLGLFVLLPILVYSFYQITWASPRFESQMQLIVQQPDGMSTLDPSMALLTGLGATSTNSDTQIVQSFINSNDMLSYLDEKISLREHFESNEADVFSRLFSWQSKEDFSQYYKSMVEVSIDEKSAIITVKAQGFNSEFATLLATEIGNKAEWYINDIGHQLADAQLAFIKQEHLSVETRLITAQTELLSFQQKYNLLNPEEEGKALAQIVYGIEAQIASKNTELTTLKGVMSDVAPQIINIENQIKAYQEQLRFEKDRLTQQNNTDAGDLSVSQVLAKFSDLKIELELAIKGFASSTISMEKSRVEAYRQLKYLIQIESPTEPEDNQYPKVMYNIALLSVILFLLYGIGRIVLSTFNELK